MVSKDIEKVNVIIFCHLYLSIDRSRYTTNAYTLGDVYDFNWILVKNRSKPHHTNSITNEIPCNHIFSVTLYFHQRHLQNSQWQKLYSFIHCKCNLINQAIMHISTVHKQSHERETSASGNFSNARFLIYTITI